ncbi:MAG TPA: hypothetical protein DDW65_05650 [Firmicutes bacterium]|jgi:formylglycine-generating enzyme|nr:hypothetical protein [Bacillota bacterium]
MKKYGNVGLILILILLLVLALSGCGGNNNSGNDGNTIGAGKSIAYEVGGIKFNMHYVPGGITFPTNSSVIYNDVDSIDDKGRATVKSAYWIAETEVTNELYNAVYKWAVDGTGDVTGEGEGLYNLFFNWGSNYDRYPKYPASEVVWGSIIPWCNALTEYCNAKNRTNYKCVYYSDQNYETPIRNGNNVSATPYIYSANIQGNTEMANCTANGFRLPTSNEWELAARYRGDKNGDGDICDSGEYYPGNHVSGDTTGPCYSADSTVTLSTVFGNYAWYDGNLVNGPLTSVALKLPNALGLYDMSGTAWEFCFDPWLDPSYPHITNARTGRGGGGDMSLAANMQLGFVFSTEYGPPVGCGFRIVRTQ